MKKYKKQNIVLPISIIVGCIILGGFYYLTQLEKQESIERQQKIKLESKQEDTKNKKRQTNDLLDDLEKCLTQAENDFIQKKQDVISFTNRECQESKSKCADVLLDAINRYEQEKKEEKQNCYQKYQVKHNLTSD
jgi:preprotein translocase subunit SecF